MAEEEPPKQPPPLEYPLIPDSEYNNTNIWYNRFFNIILPLVCLLSFLFTSFLSIKYTSPNYVFFTTIFLWLFIIYPIYY